MEKRVELFLARHAETEANALGLGQSKLERPLTPKGRAQAAALAEIVLARYPRLSFLATGNNNRTLETANAVVGRFEAAQGRTVPVRQMPEFDEAHFGHADGQKLTEVPDRVDKLVTFFVRGGRLPGGESRAEVEARFARGLQSVLEDVPDGAQVGIVSSGRAMKVIVAPFASWDTPTLVGYGFDNCAFVCGTATLDSRSVMLAINEIPPFVARAVQMP